MKQFMGILAAVMFAGVLSTGAQSGVIISGDDNETCEDLIGGGGAGACTDITPHAAWQPNNPLGEGAEWISYGLTGVGAGSFEPGDNNDPRMEVVETIVVDGSHSVELVITVWADDTAELFIDAISHSDNIVNFVQDVCADGPLGCEPDEGITFTAILAAGDSYDISIHVWQLGGGPFGVLYSGVTTAVSEPGILGLLGFGLLGVGLVRRRRRKV